MDVTQLGPQGSQCGGGCLPPGRPYTRVSEGLPCPGEHMHPSCPQAWVPFKGQTKHARKGHAHGRANTPHSMGHTGVRARHLCDWSAREKRLPGAAPVWGDPANWPAVQAHICPRTLRPGGLHLWLALPMVTLHVFSGMVGLQRLFLLPLWIHPPRPRKLLGSRCCSGPRQTQHKRLQGGGLAASWACAP